jgi:endonuclease/exonuclease/phosphatase family metal-dependent hydrolase
MRRLRLAALVASSLAFACRPPPDEIQVIRPDSGATLDAGVGGGDAATVESALRVATFNVHLFFDLSCDSGNCGLGEFEQAPSATEFEARADAIAEAIRGLDADVVSVQEIETEVAMDALASRLSDVYPTIVLGETGAPGSIDVAVLGRGQFLEARTHRYHPMLKPDGTSTYFAREFLEVHMDLDAERVIQFSAHFRSKANDDPGRRLAEAKAAREIVIASATEFPDAIVVLAGDLNDTPGSEPIDVLENGLELLRVAKDLPVGEQGTYQWNGQAEAIDHVFLSTTSRGVYVPGSAEVIHSPGAWGLAGSDHAALLADFGVE